MKSRTKNLLSEEEIRRLVEVNFGKSVGVSKIEELKGGMFNAIYRISLKDGAGGGHADEGTEGCENGEEGAFVEAGRANRVKGMDQIILKVGVMPGTTLLTYEQDVMPTEVECYRLIREKTTVPVPEVLAYDFSKKQIRSNYFFMTALEGCALSAVSKKMDAADLNRVKAKLAGYLERIHCIKGEYYGYFSENPVCQYRTWKEAFFQMFRQILSDAKEHKVKLPYQRIENVLAACAGYLEECKSPALVEYDCHEGNIFVREGKNGYEIEGIIDFERAFWGDPIADFPAAFILGDDIRKEEAFLDSYLKASKRGAYTEADAKRYQLYRLYICVIMAAETFRYGVVYAKMQGMWAKAQIEKCLKELEKENI